MKKTISRVLVPLHLYIPGSYTVSPLHGARGTYIKKCVRYGLLPIFVTTEMTADMVDALYSEADGALFMGGHDFDAKCYNEENHPESERTAPELDELELKLLKRLLCDKKPCFCICRGAQGLAIASGGSLYQHLPDLELGEEHGDSEEKGYFTILKTPEHEVIIERESKAFKLFDKEVINVTTGHHQGIKSLGADLIASGYSPSGVIEIIEHIDPSYFCFGVQGHPEIVPHGDLEVLFEEFSKAVRNYSITRSQ